MFGDGSLTLREFAMNEPLPLARIQDAVLEFLRGRKDVVLFGAQAVNAYVDEPRMTQDVGVLSTDASALAETLRQYLAHTFQIAVRVRTVAAGQGFRVYQQRKPTNRHLVDVRHVDRLPDAQRVADILVLTPVELIAQKVRSCHQRRGRPKSDTDMRDLKLLLLTYPELKAATGPVRDALSAAGADAAVLEFWNEIATSVLEPDDEDAGF